MTPCVTIIICTRNRGDSLRETLASIGRCDIPSDLPAELLVVDNGSTDHTRLVVEQAELANMPVRYLLEPRTGKGYAYNTGMAEARGEIFLFTDDDVRVPTDWIEGMCRPIALGRYDATAGAIRVAPHLRRSWLLEAFPAYCAARESLEAGHDGLLVGANMAFSRAAADRVGGFDTGLGPGALGFGDESLFSMQLRATGARIGTAPGVAVEHHFDSSRLESRSLRATALKMGRSKAYIVHHWEHGGLLSWPWMSRARYAIIMLLKRCFGGPGWSDPGTPHYWLLPLIESWGFFTQNLAECRKLRRYDPRTESGCLSPGVMHAE